MKFGLRSQGEFWNFGILEGNFGGTGEFWRVENRVPTSTEGWFGSRSTRALNIEGMVVRMKGNSILRLPPTYTLKAPVFRYRGLRIEKCTKKAKPFLTPLLDN